MKFGRVLINIIAIITPISPILLINKIAIGMYTMIFTIEMMTVTFSFPTPVKKFRYGETHMFNIKYIVRNMLKLNGITNFSPNHNLNANGENINRHNDNPVNTTQYNLIFLNMCFIHCMSFFTYASVITVTSG